MSQREYESAELIVGMEVHVELSTRTKLFTRCPSPAAPAAAEAAPNSLIDPVVLALPGSLPVLNGAALEMAILAGLALNCSIAERTKWDRKGYFYPDLPKAYQISQYDLPVAFDGALDLPGADEQGFPDAAREGRRVGIIRAHLEEDAGKLLHEAPGGHAIDHSIVDLNRAGTPLLEIVTAPDFRSAEEALLFARTLRGILRFIGVTEGVMQKGHMRFEPNINCRLRLKGGRTALTPIVEIKNLNSFRSLKAAIEFEAREQPRRWAEDGREMGPGAKVTRGWDDAKGVTFVQREKEDAQDYRYFPDPDLPEVRIDSAMRGRLAAALPELPPARVRRYMHEHDLGVKEAAALVEERAVCEYYEACTEGLVAMGVGRARAGKVAANLLLQSGAKRANERGVRIDELGVHPLLAAAVAALREEGHLNNQAADALFEALVGEPAGADADRAKEAARGKAAAMGLLSVRDDAAMERWADEAIAANAAAAADVRAGKVQAMGRLVGAVMKLAGGRADASQARAALERKLKG